jgi:hypothetical protein
MNAVLIEPDGSWTLRGHRWAAEGLELMLLAEPDAVIGHLRRWEERDWWYDEIWAEGGIVVDAGRRDLTFFGGYELVRTIPMRRRYLDVLGVVWAGWRVRWAWRRTADILDPVGLAAWPAEGPARLPLEWGGTGGPPRPQLDVYCHALSVRDSAGTLRLYWGPRRAVRAVLAAGPAVVTGTGPGQPRLTWPDPATWGDGAHVDLRTRTLTYWSIDGMVWPDPADAWPGWRLRFDEDRYENQVAECGGALVMPGPPLPETIEEMTSAAERLKIPSSQREFIGSALRL